MFETVSTMDQRSGQVLYELIVMVDHAQKDHSCPTAIQLVLPRAMSQGAGGEAIGFDFLYWPNPILVDDQAQVLHAAHLSF